MKMTSQEEGKWEYLAQGTRSQRHLWDVLKHHQLLTKLQAFQPQLVGTIPLAIDHAQSDVDIVVGYQNQAVFLAACRKEFGHYHQFQCSQYAAHAVCRFYCDGLLIELYAIEGASVATNGYRHFCIEERLLKLFGEPLRELIQKLKLSGIKTEPAFAHVFRLTGNPYEALFLFETMDDQTILQQYTAVVRRYSNDR